MLKYLITWGAHETGLFQMFYVLTVIVVVTKVFVMHDL